MRTTNKILRNLKLLVILIIIGVLSFFTNNQVDASWKEDDDGMRYELDDGEDAVGFQEIDDKLYYFDEDGYMQIGKIYIASDDAYYYADKKGIIQIGVIDTDDVFYITDESGKIKTGFVEYDGHIYYYNARAERAIGWFEVDDDWYYTDKNGAINTGFVTINDARYYFGEDGKRVSDTVMDIDGTTYIFSSDGSVDENATMLYPVYQYISQTRANLGLSEVLIDTKIQTCALLRAQGLVEGYANSSQQDVENMIKNRGVKSLGGYEFAYGGISDYGIDLLISNLQQDDRFQSALRDSTVNNVGIGIYSEDSVNYFDIILVSEN